MHSDRLDSYNRYSSAPSRPARVLERDGIERCPGEAPAPFVDPRPAWVPARVHLQELHARGNLGAVPYESANGAIQRRENRGAIEKTGRETLA